MSYEKLLIQRAAAAGTEPFHEAAADQSGVSHGLADAGLLVDLGRDQRRAAVVETPVDQFLEMRLVARPEALLEAGAGRDLDNVGSSAWRSAGSR